MRPHAPETAAEAFNRVNWRAIWPRLLQAAQRILRVLGWAEGRGDRRVELESGELLNETVKRLLDGDRQWVAEAGASEERIVAVLCETMRSIAVNHRTSAAVDRRDGSGAIDRQPYRGPSAARQAAARALLARVEHALEGDDEALALLRTIYEAECEAQGKELADTLDWRIEYLRVVRRRMARRLESGGLTQEYAAGPPSSTP